MTILESLRTYFTACPVFEEDLGVDFLDSAAGTYALETVPTQEVLTRYTDGGSLKQFLFLIAGRQYYGRDATVNLGNAQDYERLCAWLRAKNNAGDLPDLGSYRAAVRVAPLTGGYVYQGGERTARYQMQLQLIYYEGGR